MALETPPSPSELEVTLIGPNVGESVILHYQGSWFLVDSCADKKTGLPAALVYLKLLKVPDDQVKVIACTHWHDDHFKGISALCRAFPGAKFWMSQALGHTEFLEVVEAWRGWPPGSEPHTSGLAELSSVFQYLRERDEPPNFAGPNQRMWQSDDGTGELWSLSPSPEMIVRSVADIAALMPGDWKIKNALADKKPNHTSVAMHFRAGHHAVLLGSDLEEQGDKQTGWSAVISNQERPRQKSTLYKVAHHGSETGHHDGIWSDLLAQSPVSVLTPYTRSHLPRDDRVQFIKQQSKDLYISAKRAGTEVKRTGAVAKVTKTNNLTVVDGYAGLIRCRIDASAAPGEWSVETYPPAEKL